MVYMYQWVLPFNCQIASHCTDVPGFCLFVLFQQSLVISFFKKLMHHFFKAFILYWSIVCHGGSHRKESSCNAGDLPSIPGSGRSPGEGNSYLVHYSCLENSMDRGAWRTTVHGVKESDTTERLTLSLVSQLIDNVVLVSGVEQSDSVIHTRVSFFKFFSHFSCYKILSRVPCALS